MGESLKSHPSKASLCHRGNPPRGGGGLVRSCLALCAISSILTSAAEAQRFPSFGLRDATSRLRRQPVKLDSMEAPRLRPERLVGPIAELYSSPLEYSPFEAGAPLMRMPNVSRLLESMTSFRSKDVKVDSTTVHYTRVGFPAGAPITLPLEWYLEEGYTFTAKQRWLQTIDGNFDQAIVAKRRRRGPTGRLEWRVPFPGPPVVRRFIGDEGSLKINGSHTATISGKSSWTDGEVQTLAGKPSKFPALGMIQESRFTIDGKVGDAIHVRIDQDTQQLGSGLLGPNVPSFRDQFRDQLANQIKLDYKGDEDGIFQEVQAGNTTLALPGTRFVGFSQQHKGLFGIRTKGRVGPFGFTTIASQEKSQSNRQTFRGGAQVDTTRIADWRYLRNTYFWLDSRYRDRLGDFREVNQGVPQDFVPDDVIDESSLVVYINDFNITNDPEQLSKPGGALADPNGPVNETTGFFEEGTWHQLDPDNDYTLQREFGYIILRRSVRDRHALAVRYRTVGGEQFGSEGNVLSLKLIKARDMRPEFPTWDLEWKNVYRIVSGFSRGRKFERDQIRVEVLLDVSGRDPVSTQDGDNFLGLMGLDLRGQDVGTRPDQIIDANYIGLDDSRGDLIFPDLTPFDPQHVKYDKLNVKVPEIYNSHQQRDKDEASRYIVRVINSAAQQKINLSRGRLAGVDPQSVDVRLNGKRLEQGTDYTVSMLGEVTFIGETGRDVTDPGADLEITFESQDIIGLGSQQKTLLGMRGQYEFWDGDGNVGTTLLYNNERSVDRRVRVGAESARTVVWDTDVRARFKAPLLTRAVDALPLIKSVAQSDVTVQAEIAQSRPNLNTRGQGYIDDFEGSERPESLSISRRRWTPASIPEVARLGADNRARMIWYNPFDKTERAEIWPGQEDQYDVRNNTTEILVLELTPGEEQTESWNGVQTSWTGGVRDFSQAKFVELWVRGEVGELHLDIGAISEDFVANDSLDTEDIPLPGRITGDGQISEKEDVGVDHRNDNQELNYYLALAGEDTSGSRDDRVALFRSIPEYGGRDAADPEGDNWKFDQGRRSDFEHVNGTEGNRLADNAIRPDTEDLNNDGILNTTNNYFHHEIDLEQDAHVAGTESNGWRLYRRPLYDDSVGRVGSPDSSRIEYARLTFVSGADPEGGKTVKIEIAQMEIIGNDWQEDDIIAFEEGIPVDETESFNVTVIGTDENQTYKPPSSVKRRRLRNSRGREREQSLVLEFENLDSGHQSSATKVLPRNADYTKYTRLKMFVHGDQDATEYVVEPDSSDLELFVRFGRDSNNYYEFVTAVFPGWDDRNEVDIDLLTMSRLKAALQEARLEGQTDALGTLVTTLDSTVTDSRLRDGRPGLYRVSGSPSMQQIKQLTLGVRNRSDSRAYSGRVYADELRLDAARNDPGMAAFVSVNAALADLMKVTSTVDWRSENYRTITNTERKSTTMTTALSTSTNVHKFLPGSWGFSIPFKATFNRSVSLPRFGPKSDVELRPDQKEELKTQTTKELYEISISKRGGTHWISRWSLDRMNLRLSRSTQRGSSPTNLVKDRDAETMTFGYKPRLPKATLPILSWLPDFAPKGLRIAKLRYLPTTANYSMSVKRIASADQRAGADTTAKETFDMKETYTAKAIPFKNLTGNYSLQVNRDLRKKYDLKRLSFGTEVRRDQKADTKLSVKVAKWLDQSYTFQTNYEELSDPRQRRAQVTIDSLTGLPVQTRDITSKNTLSGRVNFKLPTLLKQIGKPEKAAKGKAVKGKGKAPTPVWKRMFTFTAGFIEPINTTWRRNTDARNFNAVDRAPLLFQLGIQDSLEVPRASVGLTQQDQWRRSSNTEVTTGLRFPLGIKAKPSYKKQQTKRSGSTQTRLRVEEQVSYPKINVNWSRAGRLPGIKRVMNNASMTVGFNITRTSEGEGSLKPGHLIQKSTSKVVNVTWSGQWRWGPSTTVKVIRTTSDDVDFELASRIDTTSADEGPRVRGRGRAEKLKTTINTKYNLRPRSLPLLGKLKSNVDLQLKIEFESDERSSATGEEVQAPIAQTGKVKFDFKMTYKFSDTFRGQGRILYEDNTNGITGRTRRIREVRMAGTFFFR